MLRPALPLTAASKASPRSMQSLPGWKVIARTSALSPTLPSKYFAESSPTVRRLVGTLIPGTIPPPQLATGIPAALAAAKPEPIELLAKARTMIASTFCTANELMTAFAWSALAWVATTLTAQPAAFAASVAPAITATLSASLAIRATMPRVFASTPATVEISAAEAVMNKDNATARMRVMFDPPLFDVFFCRPARMRIERYQRIIARDE